MLLLLSLDKNRQQEEHQRMRRERFAREGSPDLLVADSTPTTAEALQIVDRALRLPRRLGGAELRHPADLNDEHKGFDDGFPPPSWQVGSRAL